MSEQNKMFEMVMDVLSDHVGVEKDDILPEFSFTEDLHMSPANITDFLEELHKLNIDISKIDMTEIETIEDFLEQLESNQPIE